MKAFAVLLLCTVALAAVKAQITGEEKETFRLLAQRCKSESGATDDDIEAIIMHKSASSKEAKCLRACLMKQVDILNADGKFVKESALKVAKLRTKGDASKLAIVDEVAGVCKDTPVSDDHCEAAEQYTLCFLDESDKRGIVAVDF